MTTYSVTLLLHKSNKALCHTVPTLLKLHVLGNQDSIPERTAVSSFRHSSTFTTSVMLPVTFHGKSTCNTWLGDVRLHEDTNLSFLGYRERCELCTAPWNCWRSTNPAVWNALLVFATTTPHKVLIQILLAFCHGCGAAMAGCEIPHLSY